MNQTPNTARFRASTNMKATTLRSFLELTTPVMCEKILVHANPHTDEIATLALRWIFRKETNAKFPGFATAKVEEWGLGQTLELLGSSAVDVVAIGTLRGSLDEHEMVGYNDTCSAELFARAIGVMDDPAVQLMIEMVKREDRLGAQDGASIHSRLKTIFRMSDKTRPAFRSIIHWAVWAYIAEYHKLKQEIADAKRKGTPVVARVITIQRAEANIGKHFGGGRARRWAVLPAKAKAEVDTKVQALFEKIVLDRAKKKPKAWVQFPAFENGKTARHISLLVVEFSEPCYLLPTAVRKMNEAERPDIMIIRQPHGHMAIMSEFDFDLTEVARALRVQELKRMNGQKPIFTLEELGVVGNVDNWPKLEPLWHLHDKKPLNQLYCGAESTPLAPGTNIPTEKIVAIVKVILGGSFHGDYFRFCKNGQCEGFECPWFNLHMDRCLQAGGRQTSKWEIRTPMKAYVDE